MDCVSFRSFVLRTLFRRSICIFVLVRTAVRLPAQYINFFQLHNQPRTLNGTLVHDFRQGEDMVPHITP